MRESGLDLGGAEDEDFGRGDGVKPPLDPAPDGREEGWGSNDLLGWREVNNQTFITAH